MAENVPLLLDFVYGGERNFLLGLGGGWGLLLEVDPAGFLLGGLFFGRWLLVGVLDVGAGIVDLVYHLVGGLV